MKLMGHRGCKGEEPENTLLGFKSAIKKGVTAMEFDVHRTADGELVVIHDKTVDRTTNGKGKILEMTFSEIRSLDAGKGEKIPTLEEVLILLKENPMDIFIELKVADCEEKTVELIKKLGIQDITTVISFNHSFLKRIKEINPSIKTTPILYGHPLDPVHIIETVEGTGISLSSAMTDKSIVDKVHNAGYQVTTWCANNKEDFKSFIEMGVDFIGTDFPAAVQA